MKNILSNSTGYAIVGLAIMAGLFYWIPEGDQKSSLYNREAPAATTESASSTGPKSKSEDTIAETASMSSEKEERRKKFEIAFEREAKNVNSLNNNSEQKEIELKNWAATFTQVELDALLQKAKLEGSSANDRILATYLITLSGQRSYLKELIKQPIKDREGKVHSMDEVLNTQDRAQAIMSIDKLLESRKPEDLVELQQLAHEISDPIVKKYLHSKLNELSGL
ncbi:MAG: hypothetical protein K2Q26_02410 [Bdellovibrionales bacterium]|nr:hypothetical protein [Bdellovibrionales bacterium]